MFEWLKRLVRKRPEPLVLEEVEAAIGYRFADPSLLYRSLKHRSYSQTVEGDVDLSNERLEFLGDSVLNLVVAHELYLEHPDDREGELTKLKSTLVSKVSAEMAAISAGLERFIFLSDSEEDAGGRSRRSIVGDTYEAVIGAIFLDGGIEPARRFIMHTIMDNRDAILDGAEKNYKSLLLEYTQAEKLGHPSYRTLSEEGPDHLKIFTVEVNVQSRPCGIGRGRTKKIAQQNAACECLRALTREHDRVRRI